jgi:hypothetical protein
MADEPLESEVLEQAFRATGQHLDWDSDVEILVVGGAALALTCGLPPGRTTVDCDVMDYEPDAAEQAVDMAAEAAGKELGLPANWLNSHVQWHRSSLPGGWRGRRHFIGAFGRLRIFAADRLDLIVMKLIAGRPRDLQDVDSLLNAQDVAFVRSCLADLAKTSLFGQAAEALVRLDVLDPRQ